MLEMVKEQDITFPRFVKPNLLRVDESEFMSSLEKLGFEFVEDFDISEEKKERVFGRDDLIPSLFVFPPKTEFHENQMFKEGKLLVQSKVHFLMNEFRSSNQVRGLSWQHWRLNLLLGRVSLTLVQLLE